MKLFKESSTMLSLRPVDTAEGCLELNSVITLNLQLIALHSKERERLLSDDNRASDKVLHPLKTHLQTGFITIYNWLPSMRENS